MEIKKPGLTASKMRHLQNLTANPANLLPRRALSVRIEIGPGKGPAKTIKNGGARSTDVITTRSDLPVMVVPEGRNMRATETGSDALDRVSGSAQVVAPADA
jgi:hypothetical protein